MRSILPTIFYYSFDKFVKRHRIYLQTKKEFLFVIISFIISLPTDFSIMFFTIHKEDTIMKRKNKFILNGTYIMLS